MLVVKERTRVDAVADLEARKQRLLERKERARQTDE
jgi:hypothetical protein